MLFSNKLFLKFKGHRFQRKSYIVEFPAGCGAYTGPHSRDCLTSIFLDAGCIRSGTRSPYALTATEIAAFNAFTIA